MYILKKKYHDKIIKYHGIETINYLFESDNEDYNLYKLNQQYQSFSGKTLLPLNEYLKRIRLELTELITKNCKVRLSINCIFEFKKNPNNECNVFIESDNTTDIDEIFGQLIKKHKKLTEL